MKVSYHTLVVEENPCTSVKLESEEIIRKSDATLIHLQDFYGQTTGHYFEERTNDAQVVTFNKWLLLIVKESFHTLAMRDLKPYEKQLRRIFKRITSENENKDICYDNRCDQAEIRSRIRKSFIPKRDFMIREEIIPCQASLLQIEKLDSPLWVEDEQPFYPSQEVTKEILDWDNQPDDKSLTPEVLALFNKVRELGYRMPVDPHPERKRTYHYLPYRFDSRLEREYFAQSLLPMLNGKNLEIYFNGDDNLTGFKIDCYKRIGQSWQYIGKYVPDFLLLSRNEEGVIHKVIIIETKGEGFAAKFADRRRFMETEFIRKNNECFGYERFRFLYLEDTLNKEERERRTLEVINDFFNL